MPEKLVKQDGQTLVGFRNVLQDFTRPYLFAIEIPNIDNDVRRISAFIRTSTLPNYTIGTGNIPYQGLQIKVATTATFDAWTVTVLSDENQVLHKRFMAWANIVFDASRIQPSALKSYKVDNIKVHQLDRTGNVVTTYQFYGMFPSTVAGWTVGHDQITQQGQFQVTFNYDFFTYNQNTQVKGNAIVPGVSDTVPAASEIGKQTSDNVKPKGIL